MSSMRSLILTLCGMLSACSSSGSDQGEHPIDTTVTTRVVAQGLDHPWEIVWGPDGWIWFTERPGRVGRLNPETGEVRRILTIQEVWATSESGLLGLALHPQFPSQPYVYVAYTYDNAGTKQEKIVRYTYQNNQLLAPQTLVDGIAAYVIHDGCRLVVGPDQKLYITTGDAGDRDRAQDASSLNGKILRIGLDGTIPSDNPVAGSPIWTIGHRNPQGIAFGRNGTLYISEHGPTSDDEINIVHKGRNYGWPTVNGFCNTSSEAQFCEANNVVEPIAAWTPTLAVCGLAYYDHSRLPTFRHCLLLVNLKTEKLLRLQLDPSGQKIIGEREYFKGQFGRLRAIVVNPEGRVFFTTNDEGSDRVIEIVPGG